METLTREILMSILAYDKETGIFVWKIGNNRSVKQNDIAGCITKDGYWNIRIYKTLFFAHRLAWLYVYSVWPGAQIDHINGM